MSDDLTPDAIAKKDNADETEDACIACGVVGCFFGFIAGIVLPAIPYIIRALFG